MGRTFPPTYNATPGAFLTSALWNAQVGGLVSFTGNPPYFKGQATTAQSIPNSSSATPVTLTSAVTDTEGGWNATVNPSRYTIQTAGRYLAIASLSFPGTSSGDFTVRGVNISQNGSTLHYLEICANQGANWQGQVSATFFGNVGDYIQMGALQETSGALSTTGTPQLEIIWIGAH